MSKPEGQVVRRVYTDDAQTSGIEWTHYPDDPDLGEIYVAGIYSTDDDDQCVYAQITLWPEQWANEEIVSGAEEDLLKALRGRGAK